MKLTIALLSVLACTAAGLGQFSKLYRPEEDITAPEGCCGKALNLSPFLSAGDVKGARDAAKVIGVGNYTSYAGFFNVDQTVDNNMYWWYFPAQNGDVNAPLAIWLQGGPGGSSLFSLFSEIGPFFITETGDLSPREFTWNKKWSLLFIDNPVGAGFSYTGTGKGYRTNEKEVAADLYSCLDQFYTMFPEERKNDLYITGESYAGHYIPAFGYKIHMENKAGSKPMPLTGLAIGDGWVDPINMIPAYPQMMHVISATDLQQTAVVQSYCDNITALIEAEQYTAAFDIWDQMLNGDVWPYGNYFHNITGLNDYDNYMRTNAPVSFGYFAQFVTRPDIRAKIHVGDLPFNSGHECEMHLLGDFMKTLRPEIGVLMDNYKVLVYSGQLDVIIAPVLTDRFLPYVNWTGQAQLDQAPRYIWKVSPSDTEIAGYARVVNVGGNFTRVVLRGAGHIVPHDQPARAYDMMDRFIYNLPYSPKQEQ